MRSRVILGSLLVFSAGFVFAEGNARLEFLQTHWRKAAIYYNSGLYQDAAQEFQAVQTLLPDDPLTREALEKCQADHPKGQKRDEIPLQRNFDMSEKPGEPADSFSVDRQPVKKAPAPPAAQPEKPASPAPVAAPPAPDASGTMTKHDMEIIYNKGVSLLSAGDYSSALEQFNKILAVKPNHQPSLIRARKCRAELKKAKLKNHK